MTHTHFLDVAKITLHPFCGTLGVSPRTQGPQDVMPPGHFGGNLDCPALGVGSALWLPVEVPGALFSAGDPHAAQGHGEVAGTAIECPMSVTLEFILHHGVALKTPQYLAPSLPAQPSTRTFGVVGVGPDLMEAARDAIRGILDYIIHEYRIEPVEAYILASIIVDLRIAQVVNTPQWTVTATRPLDGLR